MVDTLRYCFLPILFACTVAFSQKKELRYDDWIYDANIKTVQFHPQPELRDDILKAPVIPFSQLTPLVLAFDHLYADYTDFRVRLVHCNYDWTPSFYTSIEILNEYNEFPINDYDFSFNTRVDYVHYRFEVPRVKVPGNYLLIVYQNGNEDDFMITRRFCVYQGSIMITHQIQRSKIVRNQFSHHQIDFTINYSGLNVNNPAQQIKVVLRQNQRWDNAITDLQPTMIRDNTGTLEYFYVDNKTNFPAGNEFRILDLRTVAFNGQGVDRVERDQYEIRAFTNVQKSRFGQPYAEQMQNDINGKYVVNNLDRGVGRGDLEGEYVQVEFFLLSPTRLNEDVYVFGQLTDWQKSSSNKMIYNTNSGVYSAKLLLKQAWYNYLFQVDGPMPYLFEGNRFETENEYEILVYFSPPGGRGDLLVGYTSSFSGIP